MTNINAWWHETQMHPFIIVMDLFDGSVHVVKVCDATETDWVLSGTFDSEEEAYDFAINMEVKPMTATLN